MNIRPLALSVLLAASALAVSVPSHAVTEKPGAQAEAGIAWYKGDVDSAFSYAKKHHHPLFLYWGAVWCPPCNQVKATVFNRQDFISRSRFFVPVHLDGDSPSAQKLGARFKVRGYPTMILFRPDGTEITRLPGEVDSARYLQVLELGMNAGRPVKETLSAALAGDKKLSEDDWRLLAWYAWDEDEAQLIPPKQLPATVQRLAGACPPGDTALRLGLRALVLTAAAAPEERPAVDQAAANALVLKVLGDARLARDNMDILVNSAADIAGLITAPQSEARAKLVAAWNGALKGLADDASLSKADRLTAVDAEVTLARLDTPNGALDAALLQEVRTRVAAADVATTNQDERQSVIYSAAEALTDAGLLDESDALLNAELKRSHSPYYFMLKLAANAKKRGDNTAALNWYEQAYNTSKGPATRLQWGSTYLSSLLELAPDDEKRIEQAADNVIREVGSMENAFYERNRTALEKIGHKLSAWNSAGKHDTVFQHVRKQLGGVCEKLPKGDSQRAACEGVLSPAQS
ncbi:MAG: thioredoxin fold domain-containing protein [Burkholderiaceae bacterium]|nr:thioredoxin fold domain-containing protein [Burkholderiaceae bacterium]